MKRKVHHRRANTYTRMRVASEAGHPIHWQPAPPPRADAVLGVKVYPRLLRPRQAPSSFMQPPQLGMVLPGPLLSYKKSTGPRAASIRTGDVQILDAFTGFLLLLKFNTYPSVYPNVGRQHHRRSAAAATITPRPTLASRSSSFCLSPFFVHQRCFIFCLTNAQPEAPRLAAHVHRSSSPAFFSRNTLGRD